MNILSESLSITEFQNCQWHKKDIASNLFPKQEDGWNCGTFVAMYAYHMTVNGYLPKATENTEYLEIAKKYGYESILRPESLSLPDSQSCDVVLHAYNNVKQIKNSDIIIVQHANVGTITTELIDSCIKIILNNDICTSVVPAHVKSEYNPYRAFKENGKFIIPFLKDANNMSANRQYLPKAYFLDHSFWVIKTSNILSNNGISPWSCLGDKIIRYETKNMFDVHSISDIKKTESWILKKSTK